MFCKLTFAGAAVGLVPICFAMAGFPAALSEQTALSDPPKVALLPREKEIALAESAAPSSIVIARGSRTRSYAD